jgi:predicted nucleic acid-binding protein
VTLVVDASVVVAALVDSGSDGQWAETLIASDALAAPHLMPAEVTNILRRSVLADQVSADIAAQAHRDLLALPIELFAYEPFGPRVWELRHNLTSYDAWYVSVAEALAAQVATLDRRLATAPGPQCAFVVPDRDATEPGDIERA